MSLQVVQRDGINDKESNYCEDNREVSQVLVKLCNGIFRRYSEAFFGLIGSAQSYCMRLEGSCRSRRGERLGLLISSLCKNYCGNLAFLHPVLNYLVLWFMLHRFETNLAEVKKNHLGTTTGLIFDRKLNSVFLNVTPTPIFSFHLGHVFIRWDHQ